MESLESKKKNNRRSNIELVSVFQTLKEKKKKKQLE
jgi:hypothetical protein